MKETTRNLENLLTAAFRTQDCPAPEILQDILLNETKAEEFSKVLSHVKNCGYCQGEVRALAQIMGIIVPAELLGFSSADLAKVETESTKSSANAGTQRDFRLPQPVAACPGAWVRIQRAHAPGGSGFFQRFTQPRYAGNSCCVITGHQSRRHPPGRRRQSAAADPQRAHSPRLRIHSIV